MSIESAKAFIERMKTDQEFAKKVNEFKTMEEVQRFITSQGYDFTSDELAGAAQQLDDDELVHINGGVKCITGAFSDPGHKCPGWGAMYWH